MRDKHGNDILPQRQVETGNIDGMINQAVGAHDYVSTKLVRCQDAIKIMTTEWPESTERGVGGANGALTDWIVRADGLQDSYAHFLDNWLVKHTGATFEKWGSRLVEFAKKTDRRKELIDKLGMKLGEMLSPKKQEEELRLGNLELVEGYPCVDATGVVNYYYFDRTSRYPVPEIGISVLPEGTRFTEIRVATTGVKEERVDGSDMAASLSPDKDYFHLVQNPVICGLGGSLEKEYPLLGEARKGSLIKPFVNKAPTLATNEWDSGGIIIKDGASTIVPLSELVAAAQEGAEVEQCLFAANQDNWRQIVENTVYKNKPFQASLMGYFLDEASKKRYFCAEVKFRMVGAGLQNSLYEIDTIKKQNGWKEWRAVFLDCGGSFSGMCYEQDGVYRVGGPSTYGSQSKFVDLGHSRNKFYVYSWPKTLK